MVAVRRRRTVRRLASSQRVLLATLTVVTLVFALFAGREPSWAPLAAASLWLLLGGFVLRLRYLLAYLLVVAAAVALAVYLRDDPVAPGVVLVLLIIAVMVTGYARGRERIGLHGSRGDFMLVDLRERIRAQATVPALEPGWNVDTVLRAAHGDAFSGDFLVAARPSGQQLEIVLADVSGKGHRAGTRSLLLSGTFGGLLEALSPEAVLSAANRYLTHQAWPEGFASAIHLSLDLDSGRYRIANAGHPPAAHFHAGSDRWDVLDGVHGPVLGVIADPEFPPVHGVLDRGDALLLYTDGMVESPDLEVDRGIDRLLGQAERVVTADGSEGDAGRIVDGTRAGEGDDVALVLVRRI
jgi:hypothetical protein